MARPLGALNKRTHARLNLDAERVLRERDEEAKRYGIDTIPQRPAAPDVQGIDGLRKGLVLAENMVAVLKPTWVKDEQTGVVTNTNQYYSPDAYRYWLQQYVAVSDKLAAYQTPKLAAVAVGEHRRVEIVVTGILSKREEDALGLPHLDLAANPPGSP